MPAMRQPSGFWETIVYHAGLALFSDMERTAFVMGAVVLLCLAVGAHGGKVPRRERWQYGAGR